MKYIRTRPALMIGPLLQARRESNITRHGTSLARRGTTSPAGAPAPEPHATAKSSRRRPASAAAPKEVVDRRASTDLG